MMTWRNRMSQKGAAIMLIAVGLAAALGGYVIVIQTTSQMANRELRHFSNTVDGFYWPEIALVQADYLDRKAMADAAAAGTTSTTQSKKKTKFLRRLVNTTVSVTQELTQPLTLLSNTDENLSFTIPGGAPPKEICGELATGKNGYRVCAYRTPALDPTGIPADVLICLEKWAAAGAVPFTQAQMQAPRRINVGNAYVAFGGVADTTPTAAPELVVVTINSLVSVAVNITLTNPNGWYCLNLGSRIAVLSGAQVDCHAHVVSVDKRALYDLYPRNSIIGTCN